MGHSLKTMSQHSTYAHVFIPVKVNKGFDYILPDQYAHAAAGSRVLVDFRGRKTVGVIKSVSSTSAVAGVKLKPVIRLLDTVSPLIHEDIVKLCRRISDDYYVSEAEALKLFLPVFLQKIDTIDQQPASSGPLPDVLQGTEWISEPYHHRRRFAYYRSQIKLCLESGFSCVLCVPTHEEIPRMAAVFQEFSPCTYSSKQTHVQAKQNWAAFKSGATRFCIGTRAAFFILPDALRLVIIEDSLHDAYAHGETPYYTLPGIALQLRNIRRIKLILHGTAPSLKVETFIRRRSIQDRSYPFQQPKSARVIDTERAFLKRGQYLSPFVVDTITKTVQPGGSVLLYYNKKGFSSYVQCEACKEIMMCKRCNIPLKYFFSASTLQCPLCHKHIPYDIQCPLCKRGYLKSKGTGIERLKSLLQRFFPDFSVDDLSEGKDKRLEPCRSDVTLHDPVGTGGILIGNNQMLSALPDGFKVQRTLVLDIDSLFYRAGHDSAFRVYYLLQRLQAITADELIVMSALTEHYALQSLHHEAQWFYEQEHRVRKEYSLPPYYKIIKLTFRGFSEKKVLKRAEEMKKLLEECIARRGSMITLSGPAKEIPFQLRERYYYSIILSARNKKKLREAIREVIDQSRSNAVKMAIIPQYE